MSDPPPGAVLITNSTGRVGWVAVDADAAPLPPGVLVAAGVPPQAEPTRSAAPSAASSRLVFLWTMPCTPPRTRTLEVLARLISGQTRAHRNGLTTGGKSHRRPGLPGGVRMLRRVGTGRAVGRSRSRGAAGVVARPGRPGEPVRRQAWCRS